MSFAASGYCNNKKVNSWCYRFNPQSCPSCLNFLMLKTNKHCKRYCSLCQLKYYFRQDFQNKVSSTCAANWSKYACLKVKMFQYYEILCQIPNMRHNTSNKVYNSDYSSFKKKLQPHKHSCLFQGYFWLKGEKRKDWNSQMIILAHYKSIWLHPGSTQRPLRLQQKRLLTVMISKIGPTSFLSDALWYSQKPHWTETLPAAVSFCQFVPRFIVHQNPCGDPDKWCICIKKKKKEKERKPKQLINTTSLNG